MHRVVQCLATSKRCFCRFLTGDFGKIGKKTVEMVLTAIKKDQIVVQSVDERYDEIWKEIFSIVTTSVLNVFNYDCVYWEWAS